MPPPKYGGFKQATFQMSQMLKQLQMIQGCIGDGNKTGHLFKATIAPQKIHDINLPGIGWEYLTSGLQEEDTFRVIGHNINGLKVFTASENQNLL